MNKKVISILMSMTMVLGSVSVPVLAEESFLFTDSMEEEITFETEEAPAQEDLDLFESGAEESDEPEEAIADPDSESTPSYVEDNTLFINEDNDDPLLRAAYEEYVESAISFKVLKDNTICITEFSGKNNYAVVPPTIDDKPVTIIGEYAFESCETLTSIILPPSITVIEESAFERCTNLTNITLPKTLTYLGDSAFYLCSELRTLTVPDSVTYVGESCFEGCTKLANFKLSSALTSIEDFTFYGCNWLKELDLSNSISSIGESAFENCIRLTSINMPASLTKIDDSAFENCSSLTTLSMPASLSFIGNRAFYNCSKLAEVRFTGNAPSIAAQSFSVNSASGIELNAYFPVNNPSWTSSMLQAYGGVKKWTSWNPSTGVEEISSPFIATLTNTNKGIQITWDSVVGAEKYRLLRKNQAGEWTTLIDTKDLSYLDTSVTSGTANTYIVRCINADGSKYTSASFPDAAKSITYLGVPAVPTLTTLTTGIKITWPAVTGASKYRIYRKTGSESWTKLKDTDALSFTDKSVQSGTKYYYTIRCIKAKSGEGTSAYNTKGSNTVFLATPIVTAAKSGSYIQVSWTKSKGAKSYVIYRKEKNGSYAKIAETTTLKYKDKTVQSGKKYTYYVVAVKNSFKSPYKACAAVKF